jgi:hypothetical protein
MNYVYVGSLLTFRLASTHLLIQSLFSIVIYNPDKQRTSQIETQSLHIPVDYFAYLVLGEKHIYL